MNETRADKELKIKRQKVVRNMNETRADKELNVKRQEVVENHE